MSSLLHKLQDLYDRGHDDAVAEFRVTDLGIWHATPLAVLAAAIPLVSKTGLGAARGRPVEIFDAGAGDGRLLAALALGLGPTLDVRLCGLEGDPALAATARDKLESVQTSRVVQNRVARVAEGNFLDPRAYERLGLPPRDLDLVFNYPDGNELRLIEWLAEHGGPQTRLVILGPDRDPALGLAPEWRASVPAEGDATVAWTLSVFAPASAGRW